MDLRPGYKQTDRGSLPDDWDTRTLGSLSTLMTNGFVGTATIAYVETDDGVLYVQGYNVEPNGFNLHGIKRVSNAFHLRNQKSCLRAGDLLTIQTGNIGVTAVVPRSLAGANCHALVISRLDKVRADPDYYAQYFNSELGRIAFKEIETGSTMKHLNVGAMVRLLVPVPPLPEQRAIAEALGDVDALLLGLDRLIAKKRDLKQAAMQQLLTGKTRLPGFSGEWEVKRLGDLFSFKNGLNKEKSFFGRGIPIVNYMDVFGSSFLMSSFIDGCVDVNSDEIRNFGIKRGDVLFTRTSETANEVGLSSVMLDCPKRMVFSGFLIRAREKEHILHNEYKSYCLRSLVVRAQIVSKASYTTRALTSGRALSSVILPIPQYSEQVAIAEVLSDMDAELMALEAQRDKTRLLKQGMMQELLTFHLITSPITDGEFGLDRALGFVPW